MSQGPDTSGVAVVGLSSGTKKKSATAKIPLHPTYADMIQQSLSAMQVCNSSAVIC